jgi:hypothetical protein
MLAGAIIAFIFIFGLFLSMVSASPKAPREDPEQDLPGGRPVET